MINTLLCMKPHEKGCCRNSTQNAMHTATDNVVVLYKHEHKARNVLKKTNRQVKNKKETGKKEARDPFHSDASWLLPFATLDVYKAPITETREAPPTARDGGSLSAAVNPTYARTRRRYKHQRHLRPPGKDKFNRRLSGWNHFFPPRCRLNGGSPPPRIPNEPSNPFSLDSTRLRTYGLQRPGNILPAISGAAGKRVTCLSKLMCVRGGDW